MQIKVPFTAESSNYKPPHSSYLSMMLDTISPHLTCCSLSMVVLIIMTICLIVPQFIWVPHDYIHFLTFTGINKVYLDTILVRLNHFYIYQAFTSMFFHMHFLHWFNNSLMLLFMLTAMEYMWWPSVLVSLLAGVVTNLYITLIFQGIFMGLSGALAAALGIYIAYLICNWDYLMANYYETMIRSSIFALFFLLMMLVSNNRKSTSLHFIGLGLGLLFGMAMLPRHVNTPTQSYLSTVFKVLSLIAITVPLILLLVN